MMRRTFLLIVLLTTAICSSAQGLRFHGSEVPIDDRTSMDIRLGKKFRPARILELQFECQLYPSQYPTAATGYIFRIKTDYRSESQKVNFFYDGLSDVHQFRAILEGQRFIGKIDIPKRDLDVTLGWTKFCITLDSATDSIHISINDKYFSDEAVDLPSPFVSEIFFGKSEFLIDVPSFSIRNFSITCDADEIHFPLDEEEGEHAHSDVSGLTATVAHPQWRAPKHSTWSMAGKLSSQKMLCPGYDESRHELYMFNSDSLWRHDFVTDSWSGLKTEETCPVAIRCATSFITPEDGDIYAYQVYNESDYRSLAKASIASIPRDGSLWVPHAEETLDMQMHHHCEGLYDGKFLIFGGFGNQRYNGSFYELSLEDFKWRLSPTLSGDKIWPRYFSAMGQDPQSPDLFYIFGGMGNESGEQVVGRRYIYDLHQVNMKTHQCKKLWEIEWEGKNCVAARNMVVSTDDSFYLLLYPESETHSQLRLYKFSINDGSFQILGDEIPILSDRITTNANLFYDKALEKMIAVIDETPDDISSTVTAYTISYPPRVHSTPQVRRRRMKNSIVLGAVGLVLGLIAFILLDSASRRKLKIRKFKELITKDEDRPDSICLFGSFTATSHEGSDLTTKFSPKLRQLFLHLLLSKDNAGLSAMEINSLLWPDKEDEAAKNIRGVTTNALRKLLQQIEGISLIFKDKRFSLLSHRPFYCDYLEFRKTLAEEKPDMDKVVGILTRGKFLRSEEDPGFDKAKSEVEHIVEVVIAAEMPRRYALKQYRNCITCADILFTVDPFSDNALEYTIKSLTALDKDEEALMRYKTFAASYRKDYGEPYPVKIDELISSRRGV